MALSELERCLRLNLGVFHGFFRDSHPHPHPKSLSCRGMGVASLFCGGWAALQPFSVSVPASPLGQPLGRPSGGYLLCMWWCGGTGARKHSRSFSLKRFWINLVPVSPLSLLAIMANLRSVFFLFRSSILEQTSAPSQFYFLQSGSGRAGEESTSLSQVSIPVWPVEHLDTSANTSGTILEGPSAITLGKHDPILHRG